MRMFMRAKTPDVREKPELIELIHSLCARGKWYCGATGNRALARRYKVKTRDLEKLTAYCWDRVAQLSCEPDSSGWKCYAYGQQIHFDGLPSALQWPRTAKRYDLPSHGSFVSVAETAARNNASRS